MHPVSTIKASQIAKRIHNECNIIKKKAETNNLYPTRRIRNYKELNAIKKKYVLPGLVFMFSALLITVSFSADGAINTALPTWEFKGAYANYTANGSTIIEYSIYNESEHSTGYQNWTITSLEGGNYSLTVSTRNNQPGENGTYNTSTFDNSSMLVYSYSRYTSSFATAMPAVNVSILSSMEHGESNLFLGTPTKIAGNFTPIEISKVIFSYKGTEVKAFRGVFYNNYTYSNNSFKAHYVIYISEVNGLSLEISSNSLTDTSGAGKMFLNGTFNLNSTNIPFLNTTMSIPYTGLFILISAAAVVVLVFSLFLVRTRRKKFKEKI